MQIAPTPLNWKEIWENAEHVATILGIGAAVLWGYFNFIKSRTYHPRMEMTVSGEIRQSGEHQYLVPRITLKNIGNSKIALVQQGSRIPCVGGCGTICRRSGSGMDEGFKSVFDV